MLEAWIINQPSDTFEIICANSGELGENKKNSVFISLGISYRYWLVAWWGEK